MTSLDGTGYPNRPAELEDGVGSYLSFLDRK